MLDSIFSPWKTTDPTKIQKAIKLIETRGKYSQKELLKIAEEAPAPEVRIAAWREVDRTITPLMDPKLKANTSGFMSDPDPMVRKECLESATHIHPNVYRRALYDKDISVRRKAYELMSGGVMKDFIPEGYDVDHPEASISTVRANSVNQGLGFIASQRVSRPRPIQPNRTVSAEEGIDQGDSYTATKDGPVVLQGKESTDKSDLDTAAKEEQTTAQGENGVDKNASDKNASDKNVSDKNASHKNAYTENASGNEKAEIIKDKEKPSLLLKHKVRSNISSKNKKNIFIHSFSNQYSFESISDMILGFEKGYDYVLWTAENAIDVFNEFDSIEFNQMQVYIPVIDKDFLEYAKVTISEDNRENFASKLMELGICVLPLFYGDQECFDFAGLFGELHGIFLSKSNYEVQIEEQLERMLRRSGISKETIASAFKRKIFLSYRKKNRDIIFDIMKSIHDTEKGAAASIWYDDFLVAGRDFNGEIKENIDNCDDFVLAVTPQLLEKDNYVKNVEYPYAREKSGKNIVPISKEATESDSYREDYPGLIKIMSVNDMNEINQSLKDITIDTDTETDYFEIYLRALSYLNGIMTEKDIKRAITLLEQASEHDIYESSAQLARLYTEGFCVKKDSKEAYKWKKKAFDQLLESGKDCSSEAWESLYYILYGEDGLIVLTGMHGDIEVLDGITEKYIAYLEKHHDTFENEIVYNLKVLEAKVLKADGHLYALWKIPFQRNEITFDDWQDLKECVKELDNLEINDIALSEERRRLLVLAYGIMARDVSIRYPADEEYLKAIELLSGSANADSYDNKKTMCTLWLNLADHYKALVSSGLYDSVIEKYQNKTNEAYRNAMVIARELVDEKPYTNNLEMLFTILFNASQTEFDVSTGMGYMREALDVAGKLEKLGNDYSSGPFVRMKYILEHALDELSTKK